MSDTTKTALDAALAAHIADECDGGIISGYVLQAAYFSTQPSNTVPPGTCVSSLKTSRTTPVTGSPCTSSTITGFLNDSTRKTTMTEVGYTCAECDRFWSTSAAADACCDEQWDRGRE